MLVAISRRDLMALKDSFDSILALLKTSTVDHDTLNKLEAHIEGVDAEITQKVTDGIAAYFVAHPIVAPPINPEDPVILGLFNGGVAQGAKIDALEAGIAELAGAKGQDTTSAPA